MPLSPSLAAAARALEGSLSRRFLLHLALAMAVGLVLRGGWVLKGWGTTPVPDENAYHLLAGRLAAGEGYSLPETGPTGAAAFAERLRELFESHSFAQSRGVTVRLTTSIGVSCFPAFGVDSVDDLVAAADQALYRAKSEGRNRVRA